MPDRRQPDSSTDDNPFAAPPEGRPDQPWQPRSGGDGRGGDGPKDPEGQDKGPARWDPTDPIQRRARYALLMRHVGLLLRDLRDPLGRPAPGGARPVLGDQRTARQAGGARGCRGSGARTPGQAPAQGGLAALGAAARPQRTAAVSGLVTASLAILLAMTSYGLQLAYKDFYVCRDDALTKTAELQCNTLLPDNALGKILQVQR